MRKWYRIIVALSSLLAISATAISVSLPQMAPLQHAKTVLVRELGVVLGVPCEVQAVEVTSTGSVRLSGVQLMLESAEAQAFVEVGDVSVDFSLWRLLRTHTVMQSIRAVRVHSLRVKLSGSGPDLLALMPEAQTGSDLGVSFPIRVSDLQVTWRHETWSERLLVLQAVSDGGLRVSLKQSVLTLAALPFPVQISGLGELVDASRLDKLALRVTTPVGRADLTGQGHSSDIAFGVKGSFAGDALMQTWPWWPLSGAGQFEGKIRANATEVVVTDGMAHQARSKVSYAVAGRYDRDSGHLDGQVQSAALPASEALAWARLAWPWEGQVAGRLHIHGPLRRLVYDIRVTGDEGRAWGQAFTDLLVDVRVADGVTTIEQGKMGVAGGQLAARGHVAGGAMDLVFEPQGILVSELPWDITQRVTPEAALEAEIRVHGPSLAPEISATFDVPLAAMRGTVQASYSCDAASRLTADVELQGSLSGVPYAARIVGRGWAQEWRLDDVQLAARGGSASLQGSVAPGKVRIEGQWSQLPMALLGVPDVSGGISGSVDLVANSGTAQGNLHWHASSLTVAGSRIVAASGTVGLRAGRLHVEDWHGTAAGRPVQVEGSLPLFPQVASFLGIRPEGSMDLRIAVPSGPLAPLLVWLPFFPAGQPWARLVHDVEAHGELRLHVTGTQAVPILDGEASIQKGKIALPQPWGSLDGIRANVLFKGSTLRFERVSAEGLGGRLSADGEIAWPNAGRSSVRGHITGDLRPKVPGLDVEGNIRLQLDGTLDDPGITGQIVLRKGTLDVGAFQVAAGPSQAALNPRLSVELMVNQLRVRAGSLLDVPVRGRLRATGRVLNPELSGQLVADRGRLNYLGTNFVVEEAGAEFSPSRGVLPRVSLWGTTWVGGTTVALQMSGLLPQLGARLTSEPPLPQQDIVALLEWPGQLARMNSGTMDLMEIMQRGIAMGLVGEVEDAVREGLGLDDFRLEPDLTQKRVRLSIGKALLPRIYLTYEQSLFSEPRGDLSLEYDLDNGWKLSAGVGDGGDVRLGVKAKKRF
jgi:autotransporter translocation and assembly factor TamB